MLDVIAETDFDGIAPVADGADGTYGDAGNTDPLNTDGPNPITTKADSDIVPDYLDLDSDNDGVYDAEEGGNAAFDTDGNGIIDCAGDILIACDTDMDGILDLVDGAGGIRGDLPGNAFPDTDGSGLTPDYRDVDSDNNGIKDIVQMAPPVLTDADNDGRIDGSDTDGDGIINNPLVDSNTFFGGNSEPTAPLPVTFANFTAGIINKAVVINWTTLSEINSSYFDVLRSTDGIKFETIGTIPAAGNSSIAINYELPDISPFKGINYYRLKIVDKDGYTDYSKIINIRFAEIQNTYVLVNPNPVHGHINLRFNGIENGIYKVVVSNSFGQISLSNMIKITQSIQKIELKLKTSLAKGIYILNVHNEKGVNISSAKILVE
jgi:hypothetical protein